MAEALVRIQFEMTKAKVGDLDRLTELTAMRSRRELFDTALTFFEWGVAEIVRGNFVATVNEKAGCYRPMLMPAFVAARRFIESPSGKHARPGHAVPAHPKHARGGQLSGPRVSGQESRKRWEARTVEGASRSKPKEGSE